MVLDKFFINVLIRVTFIVLTCLVLGIILPYIDQGYYYTLTGITTLIVLQAWLLVNYVNNTNTDLEKFFSSVQDHDSSIRFSGKTANASFKKLHDRMNNLNAVIQRIKIENERKGHFLQSMVDQVDFGLLSFDHSGKIGIYNHAALRYLQLQSPRQLTSLKRKDKELFDILQTLQPGQELLHKTTLDNLPRSVLLKATGLKFDDSTIKLVSLQDITPELDKKETESWQKLIRVLTHEIMNSVSPITSLTKVISAYFKGKDQKTTLSAEKINQETIDKTLYGLNTIEETGNGLLDFVDKYRSLTFLPEPNPVEFEIQSLFGKCILLLETTIPSGIQITTNVEPEDIIVRADFAQIEQILINLIKNAVEAMDNRKKGLIVLKAFHDEINMYIEVEDNGPGISTDISDDIFVPFFTTKKNGSGIGLSLSKQIMQHHNGSISVNSVPDKGAQFTLQFPL